jgi:hypothetical protein
MKKSNPTRKVSLVLTRHFHKRLERVNGKDILPVVGAYVRMMEVQDTLHNRKVWVLKIREGAVLAKWSGVYKLMLLTVLTTKILDRLQHRKISRFVPLETICLEIDQIER